MKIHDVQAIDFEGSKMFLKVDGHDYSVDLPSISARLANAKEAARRFYSISPSGYGIHWPEIDEDLTVDGLIAAARASEKNPEHNPLVLHDRAPTTERPNNL